MRQHRQHGVVADQERVAVGRGLGDLVGADHAGRAGAVLDHDGRGAARLAELLLRTAAPAMSPTPAGAVGTMNLIGLDG